MSVADNITHIKGYPNAQRQHIIDDIGARAFLFLRDNAEEMGIPMTDIVTEHMLGLALVMSSVEGRDNTITALQSIISNLEKE